MSLIRHKSEASGDGEHLHNVLNEWLETIKRWYPDLHEITYFVPPLFFNRIPSGREFCKGGQKVQTPQPAKNKYGRSTPYPRVYESDVQDDQAQQRIFHSLAAIENQAMMVISQLQFGKYLNKPLWAAAANYFPIPSQLDFLNKSQGDFDILIIHRQYGLIAFEVKSMGKFFKQIEMTQEAECAEIVRIVDKAVDQLEKSESVLDHLISDLGGKGKIPIMKSLIFTNIESNKLHQVLDSSLDVKEKLCHCLGVKTLHEAIGLCLCQNQLSSETEAGKITQAVKCELNAWWHRRVSLNGTTLEMTPELYEHLVSRFCGPATTIDVPCVSGSRLEIRTQGEAISEAGERFTRLALTPDQIGLLNENRRRIFLTGPPGTGKSVALLLQALEWLLQGHSVCILNTWWKSPAATHLMHYLLEQSVTDMNDGVITPSLDVPKNRIYKIIEYNFVKSKDIWRALNKFTIQNRGLFIIADEAGPIQSDNFGSFCQSLFNKVPDACLWAASIEHCHRPECLEEKRLTVSLRLPPVVVSEVICSDQIRNGLIYTYTKEDLVAPTDGPRVIEVQHTTEHGRSQIYAQECFQCGEWIADFLIRHIGQTTNDRTQPLKYKDVLVICENPENTNGLVRTLRDHNVPIRVVPKGQTDDFSRHDVYYTAIAAKNQVTVSHYTHVHGLERKVVIVIMDMFKADAFNRLFDMSRTSSQLVLIC